MTLYDLFLKPYESATTINIILEIIGTVLGIASVYFSIKKNIWVYPTGIISTVIFVYLYYNSGLLGDCMINVYYTVMSIYGWILWSKNSDDNVVEVQKAGKKDWIYASILFIFSLIFVTIIYYYKPFIDNKFSMRDGVEFGLSHLDWANWTDIFTTAVFLIGMWFMAKRKLENWIFWIIGDLICISMMIYKGLGITSLQYIVFTAMAVKGYMEWKKSLQKL